MARTQGCGRREDEQHANVVRGANVFDCVCAVCKDSPSHLFYSKRMFASGSGCHLFGFCAACKTKLAGWIPQRDMPSGTIDKVPAWPDDLEIPAELPPYQGRLL